MEMSAPILISLPPNMAAMLRKQARDLGMSPTTFAHLVLVERLSQNGAPHVPQDLIAPIRSRLARDLAQASGWADLQRRLAGHGYTLRERGGGLALFCTNTAARICTASDLGWAYGDLLRRFDAAFPAAQSTRDIHPCNDLFDGDQTDESETVILIEEE